MTHKFIEDFATADIAFEASGEDLDELFKSSAEALFEILANPKKVNKSIVKKISLSNKNIENLLYDFLSEILYIKDNDFMIFNSCNVKITELDEIYQLKVTLHGEKINPKKVTIALITFSVTGPQAKVINRAIEKLIKAEKVSKSRALELICADFLDGN